MKPSIAVCIPTRGASQWAFIDACYMPLLLMVNGAVDKPNYHVSSILKRFSHSVVWARNQLAELALEQCGADYLLMLDDDIIPHDMSIFECLDRLVTLDADIASGALRMKGPVNGIMNSLGVTSRDKAKREGLETELTEAIRAKSQKVFDVEFVCGGFTLIKADVFRKMPRPWYHRDDYHEMPEDFYFCDKARSLGFSIKFHAGVALDHIYQANELALSADGGMRVLSR